MYNKLQYYKQNVISVVRMAVWQLLRNTQQAAV